MLEISNMSVKYGAIQALTDVSLRVGQGQLVGILGANGAGKTTLLKAISGIVNQSGGSITFKNQVITKRTPNDIVRMGIAHVPEGRGIFPDLTVRENLIVGAHSQSKRSQIHADYLSMLEMFPSLARRESQDGSMLSGGEQQMLALARALMARPTLLLADEISLGLAPVITQQVFEHLKALRERGITVMLVEQNANLVMKNADYIYVLKHGQIVLEGTATELAAKRELADAYLGE
ncbi:MAG: ABC transporter ATP-binding protein [Burkholderiaceae bacterium]|nr:ABC transporter ATP-binding protein [Burkholderiaceae bacterium]